MFDIILAWLIYLILFADQTIYEEKYGFTTNQGIVVVFL